MTKRLLVIPIPTPASHKTQVGKLAPGGGESEPPGA